MAKSLNAGIFSLMGFILAVLGGAATFFVFLSRKERENTGQKEEGQEQKEESVQSEKSALTPALSHPMGEGARRAGEGEL